MMGSGPNWISRPFGRKSTVTAFFVAVSMLFSMVACTGGETVEALPSSDERIARLRERIAIQESLLPEWMPFFEALEEVNEDDYEGEDGLLLSRTKERPLFDDELLKAMFDADGSSDPGPLANHVETIVHFARQLERHGIDFLLVPIPPRAAVYPDLLKLPSPLAPGETPPLLDHLLRKLYLRFEEEGVEVIDLLPYFLKERFHTFEGPLAEGMKAPYVELVYRRQDDHWTTYGSGIAARVIGERVRQYEWYPEESRRMGRAMLTQKVRWRSLHGSIAHRMLRRGLLPSDTAEERYLALRVKIEGEIWNFNDRTSPVITLGDSFGTLTHGFPQQLLEELGFRVYLLAVPMGAQGGQLKTLRMREGSMIGKRLVIWEVFASAFFSRREWKQVDVFPE